MFRKDHSSVAQWKRAGLITQRSVDRNYSLLLSLFFLFPLTRTHGEESKTCQYVQPHHRLLSTSAIQISMCARLVRRLGKYIFILMLFYSSSESTFVIGPIEGEKWRETRISFSVAKEMHMS